MIGWRMVLRKIICPVMYQYNTSCHRSPRSHGSFVPKFCMDIAPKLFVANKDWAHIAKINSRQLILCYFFLMAYHPKKNDESPFTSARFVYFWGCSIFDSIFLDAPTVELVIELGKYYFWRNVLLHEIWQLIHLWFIFCNYHGDKQIETQRHQGNSALSKQ